MCWTTLLRTSGAARVREQEAGQPPGRSLPVLRQPPLRSTGRHRAVLRRTPATDLEASQLREVRPDHPDDGSRCTQDDEWNRPDRGDRSNDEPSEAIRSPENPQRSHRNIMVRISKRNDIQIFTQKSRDAINFYYLG